MNDKKKSNGNARRYNNGKLRYDLISNIALREIARTYTYGAEKYTVRDDDGNIISDGANNWRLGQSWMACIGSAKRHIESFINCVDVDPESNTLHLANACWNLMTIIDFYETFPQGDDRIKHFRIPKIGLDIDEVICDFIGGWTEKHNIPIPKFWHFDRDMGYKFDEMRNNGELDDFYLNLKPKINPDDLPFEPHCYITSRPVEKWVTQKWLDDNGFPQVKLYSQPLNNGKVKAAIDSGVEVFVDDNYNYFQELNEAGILCYLFDAQHNQRYDVGNLRIKSFNDLPWFKK